MPLYSSYRIDITASNQAGIGAAIYEIEMAATPGGPDLCNGVTVTASSTYSSFVAGNAVDNDSATLWSATSGVATLTIDFPAPVGIAEVRIRADGISAPKDFTLRAFNASNAWEILKTLTNETGWALASPRAYSLQAGTISGNIVESAAITDWRITSVNCGNGLVDNSAIFNGSTYSLATFTFGPVNLTLSPKIDYQWSAGKVAAMDELVVPANPDTTPHLFKVTTPGTFAGTEAGWNLSGTTTQGTAVLTYVAPLVDPVSIGPKIPA